MNTSTIEYPALVYRIGQNGKNNVFAANCIVKKLIGFGKTEKDAIENLQNVLNTTTDEFYVKVKPMYSLLLGASCN